MAPDRAKGRRAEYSLRIPAIVIARKLARGEWVEPGARPCQGMMTLEEFSDATRDLAIRWRIVQK